MSNCAISLTNNTVNCFHKHINVVVDNLKNVKLKKNIPDKTMEAKIQNALNLIDSYSSDSPDKEENLHKIEEILKDPLFDMNNSNFLNTKWKETSNYYLNRDQSIFSPVVRKIFESQNDDLIKLLLDNGGNYIDRFILCVDPWFYSHSAIILQFNKPIKFHDSNCDVAGILYSFTPNPINKNHKKNFWDKLLNILKKVPISLGIKKAYMKKILITSEDLSNMKQLEKYNNLNFYTVYGKQLANVLNLSMNTIDTLKKVTPSQLNATYDGSLKSLTSDIEKISYFFSLYAKNDINHVSKDKIVNYSFDNNDLNLEIAPGNNGYSIYDFIWTNPSELGLTPYNKLYIIEKFLKFESLKLLKEKKIIDENSTSFSFEDFYKLPNINPSDLFGKSRYSKNKTFNFINTEKDPVKAAKVGFKMLSELDKFNNKKPERYSLIRNNCITTLKRVIENCGAQYKKIIQKANKNLNIIERRHPLSVLNELDNTNNIT